MMQLSQIFMNEDIHENQKCFDVKKIGLSKIFIEHMVTKELKGSQICYHSIVCKVMKNGNTSHTCEMVLDAQRIYL